MGWREVQPETLYISMIIGGWGGIRTHGGREPTPVFKTGALNHSTTHPWRPSAAARTGCCVAGERRRPAARAVLWAVGCSVNRMPRDRMSQSTDALRSSNRRLTKHQTDRVNLCTPGNHPARVVRNALQGACARRRVPVGVGGRRGGVLAGRARCRHPDGEGDASEPARDRRWCAGTQGRRHLQGRRALPDRRPMVRAARGAGLRRERHRILLRRGLFTADAHPTARSSICGR
jgi:hypothetical protein